MIVRAVTPTAGTVIASASQMHVFTITDPCEPPTVTTTSPAAVTYTVGAPATNVPIATYFSASPATCALKYSLSVPAAITGVISTASLSASAPSFDIQGSDASLAGTYSITATAQSPAGVAVTVGGTVTFALTITSSASEAAATKTTTQVVTVSVAMGAIANNMARAGTVMSSMGSRGARPGSPSTFDLGDFSSGTTTGGSVASNFDNGGGTTTDTSATGGDGADGGGGFNGDDSEAGDSFSFDLGVSTSPEEYSV